MSEGCYFCGGGEDVLERHHVVPRRLGGTDEGGNLVDLCPTCHRKLESLYDDEFYEALGVDVGTSDSQLDLGMCARSSCGADADWRVGGFEEIDLCDEHKVCSLQGCDSRDIETIMSNGSPVPYCEDHRTCQERGCSSTDTRMYNIGGFAEVKRPLCPTHAEERDAEVTW